MTAPPRLTVFGSVNMDLVAYVAVAPRRGETVPGREFRTVPGGKGANQAVAAARAGGRVAMLGAVGSDAFGDRLRATLAAAGVDTSGLRTVDGPSGTAHIVVDDEGGNSIVVVPGANGSVTGVTEEDAARIAASDALLLQLELPMAAVTEAARVARRHKVRTLLTPAPAQPLPPELLAATDVLVPNEHEAAALTGVADPLEAAERLLEQVPEVVVTRGEAGSVYASRDGRRLTVPAVPVRPVDTTAAGDTYLGALAVALGEGRAVADAMAWASAAAALSVQLPGASASMPTREQIDALANEAGAAAAAPSAPSPPPVTSRP